MHRLDPVAEGGSVEGGSVSMDEAQAAAQQQPEQGRKQESGFERGAAGAGGQSPKLIDDPVEAAADKSEGEAMKVCTTLHFPCTIKMSETQCCSALPFSYPAHPNFPWRLPSNTCALGSSSAVQTALRASAAQARA